MLLAAIITAVYATSFSTSLYNVIYHTNNALDCDLCFPVGKNIVLTYDYMFDDTLDVSSLVLGAEDLGDVLFYLEDIYYDSEIMDYDSVDKALASMADIIKYETHRITVADVTMTYNIIRKYLSRGDEASSMTVLNDQPLNMKFNYSMLNDYSDDVVYIKRSLNKRDGEDEYTPIQSTPELTSKLLSMASYSELESRASAAFKDVGIDVDPSDVTDVIQTMQVAGGNTNSPLYKATQGTGNTNNSFSELRKQDPDNLEKAIVKSFMVGPGLNPGDCEIAFKTVDGLYQDPEFVKKGIVSKIFISSKAVFSASMKASKESFTRFLKNPSLRYDPTNPNKEPVKLRLDTALNDLKEVVSGQTMVERFVAEKAVMAQVDAIVDAISFTPASDDVDGQELLCDSNKVKELTDTMQTEIDDAIDKLDMSSTQKKLLKFQVKGQLLKARVDHATYKALNKLSKLKKIFSRKNPNVKSDNQQKSDSNYLKDNQDSLASTINAGSPKNTLDKYDATIGVLENAAQQDVSNVDGKMVSSESSNSISDTLSKIKAKLKVKNKALLKRVNRALRKMPTSSKQSTPSKSSKRF